MTVGQTPGRNKVRQLEETEGRVQSPAGKAEEERCQADLKRTTGKRRRQEGIGLEHERTQIVKT